MFYTLSLVAAPAALLLATLPGASAHARVSDIRVPGPAHLAKCGKASFDEVTKDPTGHIEDQEPVNPGCELQLCRGLLFADQAATAASTVKTAPGGNMTFKVDCTIPHGGPATVSLIDTTTGGTGTVIGNFLKEFDSFCPAGVTPPDQSTLQVTLPDAATIAGRCGKPGDCVTQLFWATPDLSQNYYYCKDTIISGSATTEGSSSVPAAAPDQAGVRTAVADAAAETQAEETAIVDQPTAVEGADTAVETGVADAEVPADTGAEETAVVDQPTAVEGADTAVETGVDGAATPTGTAGAAAPTKSAAGEGSGNDNGKSGFQKFVDFFKNLIPKKSTQAPQATTPVEPPTTVRRWVKEHN